MQDKLKYSASTSAMMIAYNAPEIQIRVNADGEPDQYIERTEIARYLRWLAGERPGVYI